MSKIEFDFNNAIVTRIGKENGINVKEIESLMPHLKDAVKKLKERKWGFVHLPYNNDLVSKINSLSENIIKKFDNFVVLGIGGSALGNRTLNAALPPKKGRPGIFVLDNIDPDTIKKISDNLDFSKTLFNVITKSGNTAETMSNFMIFRKLLIDKVGYEKHKEHIIVTTDPAKGSLREIEKKEGYISLEIPPEVGGRFSVLSSVGLLSAAVGGIDISQLLEGARNMDELCQTEDMWSNPGCMSAVLQYLFFKKGRNICVFMPYSSRLKNLAEWFSQLWAESLGKTANIGSTPVKALGVTDQHSQLQLYMEGPRDKFIVFVKVKKFDNTVVIPKEFSEYSKISYLGGRSLNELIDAEQKGTELALTKTKHPNCAITLNEISPYTIGGLLYMLEVQTAVTGELFKIDTFNQPGVEESKQITGALLGKPGSEKKSEEIRQLPEWDKKFCIKT